MARMQGKTTSDIHQLFAGIDVSKAHLDLQLSCERRSRRFPNSPAGWAAIDAHLRARADTPCLIALEPTGRHHFPVWRALHAAGHGVAPLNPLHVRRFAESGGELTKTDALDAAVLARMAAERCPAAKAPPSEEQLRLKALTTSIADRTDRRATLKGQRAETRDPLIARFDEAEIARLSDAIDALKAERARLINANPQTARVAGILCSIPGLGEASAHRITTDMPEIGTLDEKQAAALLGAAPRANQSGKRDKRRHIKGGRRRLRAALHMPAIVASNANPDLKEFKQRLKSKGKNNAVILTAILRKLIILANALVAQNRMWTPKCP
jgi:transposase